MHEINNISHFFIKWFDIEPLLGTIIYIFKDICKVPICNCFRFKCVGKLIFAFLKLSFLWHDAGWSGKNVPDKIL